MEKVSIDPREYVVFDVETNGLKSKKDDLLSISFYKPDDKKEYSKFLPLECRVLNKDFYDGVVDTAPLVGFLLMIPMFNKAAELCVPYFNALLGNIIPNNTLVISIVFAILAPLGLFRGPFTLFGCGAATLGILKGIGFSTPYLYALMVIPSITMNVSICMTQSWIAWGVSYSKVSTREHLKMTLPYAWLVCIIMQAITYVMFG